ncbi:hypothetical protein DL96DRAFT_1704511 [Flagelloscypha sp. PMI_526]|nr:hypothetical protein DL96DRAFT_1704511 [Flagelloscypha sp. PMI_526]
MLTACRFGRGVYTTKCSSKADDYIINYLPERQTRVMIVAEVVLGKTLRLERNAEYLSEPPFGFHSVVGVPGQALHYQENVVYSDNAIRPAFLIIYEAPQGAPAASSSQNSSEVKNPWQ